MAADPNKKNEAGFVLVDFQSLLETANGDESFIEEIINIFLSEIRGNIQVISEGFDTGNFDAIGKIAHKLKSSFAILGVMDGWDTFNEIETISRDGTDKVTIEPLVQKAISLCEAVEAEFLNWKTCQVLKS